MSRNNICLPIVIILLIASPSRALGDQRVGTVSSISGEVSVDRDGHRLTVLPAAPVNLHDKFATGARAHLTITLLDGSRLELAKLSSLAMETQTPGSGGVALVRLNLMSGRLDGFLSPSRPANPKLEVVTPNAIAQVRGARFTIAFSKRSVVCGYKDSSEIAVHEGVVMVALSASPNITVPVQSGYETVVCAFLPPLPPGPLGLAGMNGVFEDLSQYAGSSAGSSGMPPPICPPCPIAEVR